MYIVAVHSQLLKNNKNPSEGFITNEHIRIDKKLKSKDYANASIILDVANQKVIKNRFTDRSFEELYAYFIHHNANQINKWIDDQIKKEYNNN